MTVFNKNTLLMNPRFGCRLLSFYSGGYPGKAETLTAERRAVRQDLFLTADDSLKCQSQGRDSQPHEVTLPDTLFTKHRLNGNHDGWGLVTYQTRQAKVKPILQVHRSEASAATDSEFEEKLNGGLNQGGNIVMAHIRGASIECKDVHLNNVHPFTRGNLSWMHNGIVNGALSPVIKKRVHRYEKLLGFKPEGNTDSEYAFHLFLGNLKKKYGTLDTQTIGLEKVRTVFAQTMRELLVESTPNVYDLDGGALGLEGRLTLEPVMNFVFSDGHFLMASRKNIKLFLGEKKFVTGEVEYIVSSEAIGDRKKTGIQWLELDEESVLTLDRGSDGTVKKNLYSFKELAPESFFQRMKRAFRFAIGKTAFPG